MNEDYFRTYGALRAEVLAAGPAGEYKISGHDYVGRATTAINSILGLADSIGAAADTEAAEQAKASASNLIISVAILLASIGLASLSFWVAISRIVRPLSALTGAMGELASGNFAVVLPGLGRKDEVGDMAHAVETFKVKAEEKAHEVAAAKIRQDKIAAEQRRDDMHRLAGQFETAVGEIVDAVRLGLDRAGSLRRCDERDGRAGAKARRRRRRRLAGSLRQRSVGRVRGRAIVHLRHRDQPASAGFGTNGQRSGRPGAADRRAYRRFVEGGRQDRRRHRADRPDRGADQSARAQCNDRSGEGGRVRSRLRGGGVRGQGPCRPDGQGNRRDHTADHRHPVGDPGIRHGDPRHRGTISRLSEIAAAIAAAVEEQGAATQEITRNVQQAAKGTQQASTNVAEVERGAAETGASSSQVLSAAQMLSRDSNRLKLEVGKFLNAVRAA